MSRRTRIAFAAVVAVLSLAACAVPAMAAFPGPNGKIAFFSNRDGNTEVIVMDPDGQNQTNITNHGAGDVEPSFSADGRRIAFSSGRDGDPGGEIYVMDADGQNVTRLTTNSAFDREAAFSPDGSKLVFVSNRDGDFEVYVMDADGQNVTQLTNNAALETQPSFSADGSKIVFVSNRDGNNEVYVMDADGQNQTNLTNNTAIDSDPSFSPDGSKIAFVSTRDGNNEIYVMDADGQNQNRLTDILATDRHPAFSPDGTKVAFVSTRDNAFSSEIYVMGADGQNQTRLTDDTASDFNPDWGRAPYSFTGFFAPVDNPDTVNQAKAGSSIPVKFSLDGDQGLGVLAIGSPTIERYTCGDIDDADPIEQTTTANTGLTYNALTDTYTYVWKTDKAWKGKCATFTLTLTDGTEHTALFQFK